MSAPQNLASYEKGEIMKTKKAVPMTAKTKLLHYKSYPKSTSLSRADLKENLGLLLFRLQNSLTQKQHKIGWQLFEVLLTQYIQNLTECPSEPLKSKNSAEGGIG